MTQNKSQEINLLNNLLQGTYIGIDEYKKCVNRIKDKNIRSRLEHQEIEHRKMADELSSRIRELGGTPKDNAGTKGTMASFMSTLRLADSEDTPDVLALLMNGVKASMNYKEKLLTELNGPSRNMLEKHLSEDKKAFLEIENIKRDIFKQ